MVELSDYTPTEARVCIDFCNAAVKRRQSDGSYMTMEAADAAFTRWLAAHDAAKRAEWEAERAATDEATRRQLEGLASDYYEARSETEKVQPAADLANVTPEGIVVLTGQRWRSLDKRDNGRTVTVEFVSNGKARVNSGATRSTLSIKRMRRASTGWALVNALD